jgi:transposase-like protein
MVAITQYCLHCQSVALVRNGHVPNGKQLYRCHSCGRQSRENPTPNQYPRRARRFCLHTKNATACQGVWPF